MLSEFFPQSNLLVYNCPPPPQPPSKSAMRGIKEKNKILKKLSLLTNNKMKTFFFYFSIFQTKYMLVHAYMITMNTFFTRKHYRLNCYTFIIINWTSTNVNQNIMWWTYFTQEDSSRYLWNAPKTDINNF